MKPHSPGLDIKNMDHVLKIHLCNYWVKLDSDKLFLSQTHETSQDLPPLTKDICLQRMKYPQYYNGKNCVSWSISNV